ncbi:MAG: hypothetical protein MZV64_35215 [Ignavibacteriales bacterium]|nr:hypothetical protein [Ignavibacteriales bacterium]
MVLWSLPGISTARTASRPPNEPTPAIGAREARGDALRRVADALRVALGVDEQRVRRAQRPEQPGAARDQDGGVHADVALGEAQRGARAIEWPTTASRVPSTHDDARSHSAAADRSSNRFAPSASRAKGRGFWPWPRTSIASTP